VALLEVHRMLFERKSTPITLIFVGVEHIPTVNVVTGKLFGSVFLEVLPLRRRVIQVPGIRKHIAWIVYPRRARDLIGGAEPSHRRRAEGGPPLILFRKVIRKRVGDQQGAICRITPVPVVHEIAQCGPGPFPLADFFKGQAHGLAMPSWVKKAFSGLHPGFQHCS
jgi:hypothetical protein